MEINFKPNPKQYQMLSAFDNPDTTEILYGGAAGGGKTYGLCAMIIVKCLQYAGIRVGFARLELAKMKETTMPSFFKVCSDWGLMPTRDYVYNSNKGTVKFSNGSEVVLVQLSFKPSDPLYQKTQGYEFTFGVIDEVGEIDERGFNAFKSRLGRWENKKYNLKPLCIMTCNPVKNWLYKNYYKADKEGKLLPYQLFIPALVTDNTDMPQSYIDNLMNQPFSERQRLLHGNWDYDDDPTALLSHPEILNIWENVKPDDKKKFITADIAFTTDKLVVMLWHGMTIVEILVNPQGNIEDVILDLASKNGVPNYNIAYDSDGVGKFLDKRLRNSRPIVNNAAALEKENYKNLKTQLYFKLCEAIQSNKLKCAVKLHKTEITEELQVIRHKPTATVGKIEMVDKGEVKRLLGRSPDFSDTMAFRMIFEYGARDGATYKFI